MTANSKKAQKDFTTSAARKPGATYEEIVIPAHREFDGISCHEDGMSGKLSNVSAAYIESVYSFSVPETTLRLKKLPEPKPFVAKTSPKGQRATVVYPEHRVYDVDAIRQAGVSGNLRFVPPDIIAEGYSITIPRRQVSVKNEAKLLKEALKGPKPTCA